MRATTRLHVDCNKGKFAPRVDRLQGGFDEGFHRKLFTLAIQNPSLPSDLQNGPLELDHPFSGIDVDEPAGELLSLLRTYLLAGVADPLTLCLNRSPPVTGGAALSRRPSNIVAGPV